MTEVNEIREITEAELPESLREHWKNAKASVERNNPGYAVKFLQAILKECPGFLNARKLRINQKDKWHSICEEHQT